MTYKEAKNKIMAERKFVDKKPYSHNIISSLLSQVAGELGYSEANRLIRECNLISLGWQEEKS